MADVSKSNFVMLSKGYAALRRSRGVEKDLIARAERIAAQAKANAGGKGEFEVQVENVGRTNYNTGRIRVSVVCADYEAMRAEAETRALTRAIQAGG